ncbi:MAG: hypothetical protein E7607_05580 [Ruminococcaceae bacterium]|nr:hypothetical protein [Oscillospiraceae bacterium]
MSSQTEDDSTDVGGADIPDNDIDRGEPEVTIEGVELSLYSIVYSSDFGNTETDIVYAISDLIIEKTGKKPKFKNDTSEKTQYEIIVGDTRRESSVAYKSELVENGYIVKYTAEGDFVILYDGVNAAKSAKRQILEIITTQNINAIIEDPVIVSSIGRLRDPSILLVDGIYYAYGTRWHCFKNTGGRLDGKWEDLGVVVDIPADAKDNYWAPEVHEYKGEYYMFTTYLSEASGHRGCVIMKSSKPEGPFTMITDGHITPKDWDSIDGTLYIDEDGQPWMVFVHEWTSTDDGIGRMAAAKLSDDLTRFISEPIELFRADDPSWSKSQVTDGCWMYKCSTGELLMIWSTSDSHGYCVGIARSDNGRLDGNWTHDEQLLYSKSMTEEYDGGHGMIFKSISGKMYLSIHSPNSSSQGREETPVFIAIREENGTLVWDE